MALTTESWGDRWFNGLDRHIRERVEVFGPPVEELFRILQSHEKEHEMGHILYDLVDVQGSETRGSYTACRVCGAVVTVADHEKHDEWHERVFAPPTDYEPPHSVNFEAVFSEGTGVAVCCPHCGSMNCRFRDEFTRAGKRRATLPFRCTKCENKFNITFEGTERWTGMVTESTS